MVVKSYISETEAEARKKLAREIGLLKDALRNLKSAKSHRQLHNKHTMRSANDNVEFAKIRVKKAEDNLKRIEEIKQSRCSNILDTFNPIEGGETILYYLRLNFKGRKYYKIGVTLKSVKERYSNKDFEIIEKILYEKRLTFANTIERQIIKKFEDKIFPLSILSSGESEIFDEDILKLDN